MRQQQEARDRELEFLSSEQNKYRKLDNFFIATAPIGQQMDRVLVP